MDSKKDDIRVDIPPNHGTKPWHQTMAPNHATKPWHQTMAPNHGISNPRLLRCSSAHFIQRNKRFPQQHNILIN